MENESNKSRRVFRRLLWASLAIILLIVIAIFGISGYAAYSMIAITRQPITQTPAKFGIKYSDISFPSTDGLTLGGLWLEGNQDHSVIIMVHGSDGNRADSTIKTLDIAAQLISHG